MIPGQILSNLSHDLSEICPKNLRRDAVGNNDYFDWIEREAETARNKVPRENRQKIEGGLYDEDGYKHTIKDEPEEPPAP